MQKRGQGGRDALCAIPFAKSVEEVSLSKALPQKGKDEGQKAEKGMGNPPMKQPDEMSCRQGGDS